MASLPVRLAVSLVSLSLAGAGALGATLLCAWLMAQHWHHGGSLSCAALLSARNDTVAKFAIIVAGFVTAAAFQHSGFVVGSGVGVLSIGVAWEVREAGRGAHAIAMEP